MRQRAFQHPVRTKQRKPLAAVGAMCLLTIGWQQAAVAQTVLPQGASVVSGSARISQPSASSLVVNQNSSRAIVNWNSFSVGQNGSVNFVQPDSNSAILNRVTGSTTSTIAGQINSNGQVYLVNPNGIAITSTGAVQTGGGFVASTLDIGNSDFNSGNLNFRGNGASAGVSNAGTISAGAGGFVGLIGGTVSNSGTINVPLGKVGLGSGEQITLDPTGDGFMQVAVPTNAAAADGTSLVDVAGRISARGGSVEIKAATAQQAVRDAVNVSGTVSARTASGRSGSIVLGGGDGGNVLVTGKLLATGGKRRNGGAITVTGNAIGLKGATLDASGGTGGGTIQIGGGRQGTGPLQHAQTTAVDQTSVIRADATVNGNGGNVVVWSDGTTSFAGNISARGGAQGGNGGQVEVSSHGVLSYAGLTDTRAPEGHAGNLLLDPYDVIIQSAFGSPSVNCFFGTCSPSNNSSVLTVSNLQVSLALGNVTVTTGSGGSQNGDIYVNNAVTWSNGNTLTMNAAGGIFVASGANITATGGGSMALNAGTGAITVTGATLSTNGGNLTLSATSVTGVTAISFNNATLSVGTGQGTITGSATSGLGISFNGDTSISSSGGGSFNINGTSNAGSGTYAGIFVGSGATLTTSGTTAVTGSSSSGAASIYFQGSNTVTDTSGDLNITGTTNPYRGIEFWGSQTLVNSGAGTLSFTGTTTSTAPQNGGLQMNHLVSLQSSGNVVLTGNGAATPGIGFDTNTVTVSSGNLTYVGTSTSGSGVNFYATTTLTNNGTGSLNISGTSSSSAGINVYSGSPLTTSGTVSLSGTSTSGSGILLSGTSLTAASGTLVASGTSGSGIGVEFTGGSSLTNSGASSMMLAGTSNSGAGTQLDPNTTLTTNGDMSLSGTTNSWLGFYVPGGATLTVSSGALSIAGASTSNSGVFISGNDIFTNAGGTLSFNGTSSTYRGIDFYDSATVAFSGGVALRGTSTSGNGVNFQRNTILDSGGDVTVTGNSNSGVGINFNNNANSFTNTGSGNIVLTATSASNTGIYFGTTGGSTLTTSGNMSLTGTSASGVGFLLNTSSAITQSSGNLSLTGNDSSGTGLQLRGTTSITNNGSGTLALNSTGTMDIGGTISSPSGVPTLVSSTDILFDSGASISGASPVLAATGAFINNAGSAAVTATSGRWLIYSNTPGADTFGNLDSTNTAIWNTTYAGSPPASIAATGNRYLFAYQPVLTVTTTDASKTYGTDATSAIGSNYTITGLQASVAGAYLGDTSSSISGAPLITSTGAPATAGVAGSPYAINASLGTLSSSLNYAFAFQSLGTLTVNPALVDVTANGGSSTYGSSPGNPGLSASGLRNSDGISALTGLSNSFGITNTANAGSYATNVTGTLTNPNYVVNTLTGGTWNVNAAPVTVTALGGSSTYGSTPVNPGLTASGLQNSQSASVLTGLVNSLGATSASNAGTYTNTVGGALTNPNYYVAGTNNGTSTVNPASVSVTALGGSSSYGSSPANPGLSASGLQNGDTVATLTGLSNSFGITSTTPVGNYTTSVNGSLTNPNYTLASTSNGTWTVGTAVVTVTALGGSSTFGGSPANPGLSATGLQNGDTVSALTGLYNTFNIAPTSNAGTYTFTVGGTLTNPNYTMGPIINGTWTVNPAPVTVTALGGSSTYGGSPSNPGLSASGLQNGDSVGVLTGLANSFGITNATNAGSYATNVTGTLTNANYVVNNTVSGAWIVNPAPVTVTALGGSSTYGSAPVNPGLSATGLQNGQNASVLTGLVNALGATSASNVGTYTNTVGGTLTNANYVVTGTSTGSSTVNSAPISVTALGGSSNYGSSPANPGLSASGLQNGDTVAMLTGLGNSFGITNTTPVGSYATNVAGSLTNPNYTVTSTNSGTWLVNTAVVTVTALGGSSTYGSSPSNPGLSATGLQNGDTASALTGLYNTFGVAPTSNAGTYALTVGGTLSNPNYTMGPIVNGAWTVNPAPVSVTALGGSSDYGKSPANPGLSVTGLQNNQDVSVLSGLRNSFGITGATAPGSYDMTVTGSLTNHNYTVTSTSSEKWTVALLRGSTEDANKTPIQGGGGGAGGGGSADVLDGLSGASGSVNAGSGGRAAAAAASSPAARTSGNSSAPGSNSFTPSSLVPDFSKAEVVAPQAPQGPQGKSPASSFAQMSDCGGSGGEDEAGGGASRAGGTVSGHSGGACGPKAAPKAAKQPGLIDFALTQLNRSALFDAMNKQFSEITESKSATPAAALTKMVAGTSLAVTAGIVGWLLRGGALLTALLSSMPLWRQFDPLAIVLRPKRRPEDEDEISSHVDRMFEDTNEFSAPGSVLS